MRGTIDQTHFDVTLLTQDSNIAALRRLLANRQHHAFLEGMLLALEEADQSHLDYLRALGGEGLYIALRHGADAEILGSYASLLLAQRIHAPVNVVLALNGRMQAPDLLALAEDLIRNAEEVETDAERPVTSPLESQQPTPTITVKRVIQLIDMGFGSFTASDALGIKRSVFRSEQEKTFLQALALRFPALNAFPNYPLDQLADFAKLRHVLDAETLRFGRNCRIDAVLVVPGEGDPVAAFELDSRYHDDPLQQHYDRLKNRLFQAVQIPFYRLRAENTLSVGVDEWYALLTDEVADKIDCERRLRVRTSHPTLIPS